MQECRELLRAFCDYLDGALDPQFREGIDLHLKDCRHCRILYQTTRTTLDLYKSRPANGVPADIECRLLASLERRFGLKC
jgi:predicted anti-sigma-YlaC factor YlaD